MVEPAAPQPVPPCEEPLPAGGAPISVLVLTRNEVANIADCLRTLTFSDDVVVLDSLSSDGTVEAAEQFANVRVVRRAFDTEYRQRNYGLHEIAYRHPWLYVCDADERVPAALAVEMAARVAEAGDTVAYRLRYKNMFRGRWIKHATTYPVWLVRLLRPERAAYEVRQTNVHPIVDGPVGELREHFIHYSFNSGIRRWLEKHNFYSEREAIEAVAVRQKGEARWRDLLTRDPMARRRAAKNLSFLLRGRAFWRFAYAYLLRMGFLDGLAGFHYCAMVAMYEYWIEVKVRERERAWDQATLATEARLMGEEGR